MSRYLPLCLQNYPFRLEADASGGSILAVASDRVVSELHEDARPFFVADGGVTEEVEKHQHFLERLEKAHQSTLRRTRILEEEGLIVEWPLKIRLKQGGDPKEISGLYRIDAERLLAFDGSKLEYLKQHGVLTFALSQSMSVQHVNILMERAAHLIRQEATGQRPAVSASKPSFDLSDDEMISF